MSLPLFTAGWIAVPSFTALMALALGVGLLVTWRQARQAGLPTTHVLDAVYVGILAGLIAGRVVYVTTNWNYFANHQDEIAQVWQGGVAGYAAWVCGLAAMAAFSMWRGDRSLAAEALDAVAPGLMAAAAIGWVACYLGGPAYGRELLPGDRWWFLAADLPDVYGLHNPRFATQLLGAGWSALALGLAWMLPWRRLKPGVRFAAAMAFYSAGMWTLGLARADTVPMVGAWRLDQMLDGGITIATILYIIIAAFAPNTITAEAQTPQRNPH